MDAGALDFGAAVRALRQARKVSLEKLARDTGLSMAFLSKLERGLANPTLAHMERLSRSLGMSLPALISKVFGPGVAAISRGGNRARLSVPGSRVVYELVTPHPTQSVEAFVVRLGPGECDAEEPVAHGGDELVYVLCGRLACEVEGCEYVLDAHDSVFYPALARHRLRNPFDAEAVALCALSPPMF